MNNSLDLQPVETELPYKPKGWRNLYIVLSDHATQNDLFLKAGSIYFGFYLFPTRETAVMAVNVPNSAVAAGVSEWLGAFEVEE